MYLLRRLRSASWRCENCAGQSVMQNFKDLDVLRSTLKEHELDEILPVDNWEFWLIIWML